MKNMMGALENPKSLSAKIPVGVSTVNPNDLPTEFFA